MKYSENGETVTLEMSWRDYERLLLAIGIVAGVPQRDERSFWDWIDFVNRLNTGNPRFVPYEIPAEFQPRHANPS